MQLTDHPQMKWGGKPIWPFQLVPSYAEGTAKCGLEGGILKEVQYLSGAGGQAPYLLLEVDCDGNNWPGLLKLDDPVYLEPFYHWLKHRVGKSIKEIGQDQVDF